jgi:SAM-dependent methyltransferase
LRVSRTVREALAGGYPRDMRSHGASPSTTESGALWCLECGYSTWDPAGSPRCPWSPALQDVSTSGDVSLTELEQAPTGAYDDVVVADIVQRIPELEEQFDVVLSWQVFEHVKPLDVAVENVRTYLRPGGLIVAQLSGTFSAFGLLNRMVPFPVASWIAVHVLGRHHIYPPTIIALVLPLRELSIGWNEQEILPREFGGRYSGSRAPSMPCTWDTRNGFAWEAMPTSPPTTW